MTNTPFPPDDTIQMALQSAEPMWEIQDEEQLQQQVSLVRTDTVQDSTYLATSLQHTILQQQCTFSQESSASDMFDLTSSITSLAGDGQLAWYFYLESSTAIGFSFETFGAQPYFDPHAMMQTSSYPITAATLSLANEIVPAQSTAELHVGFGFL